MSEPGASQPQSVLASSALAAILVASAVLMFWDLGDVYLWQDEAQTALLARSVLEHGVPMGFDGANHFSQELGAEYGDNGVWRWHTWLPFYVLAALFAVFGESTLVARLPFALAGFATVAATYGLGRRLSGDRPLALAAATLLALSVPFLLLSRQSRWYSFSALFCVLALWGYLQLVAGKRRGGVVFALAIAALFHTHYFYAAAVLASAAIHAALWHRDRLRAVVGWTVAILPLCAPWIIWLATGMEYSSVYGDTLFDAAESWNRLWRFVAKLLEQAFPPFLVLVAVGLVVLGRRSAGRWSWGGPQVWRPLSLLLIVIGVHLIGLALVSPGPFFRYLTPLLPLLALVAGGLAVATSRIHRIAPWVVVGAVVVSTPLASFVGELRHDFRGPIEGIVEHLRSFGRPGDVVAISYGDLPLKFYTSMTVLGGLTGEDLAPGATADWVILRRNIVARDRDGRVRAQLREQIDPADYERFELEVPDTRFENREEPSLHRFRSAESGEPVVLLRRIADD